MEEEFLKTFRSSNVALVAKGNRPKINKNNRGRQYKRVSRLPQKGKPKVLKASIARVKCYNCGKKGHYAWIA